MKISRRNYFFIVLIIGTLSCTPQSDESKLLESFNEKTIDIIAYYSGSGTDITNYPIEKLDQIIYSFLHLKGNTLTIDNADDSLSLLQITALKSQYPKLKVLVSLGGWGGCETCSEVFSNPENHSAFAKSVVKILKQYNADGIDLDWEYPAIPGYPGHSYKPDDKQNFTALVSTLREVMGNDYELSFAAGGSREFLENSIAWEKVMPHFDRVNLMSYDLVNGFSQKTGHHTSLYSNSEQILSADHAIHFLDSIGVPSEKIVIGAAFYARIWENVSADNNGLYQSGDFLKSVNYPELEEMITSSDEFQTYWDTTAYASHAYSSSRKQFASYDDSASLASKVAYVKKNNLGGIMFWELRNDKTSNGLLDIIFENAQH